MDQMNEKSCDSRLLRRAAEERDMTEATVHAFIEQTLATDAPDGERSDDVQVVMRHALETLYPRSVDNVYAYSESPIERVFLNSLIFHFLAADPLDLIVTVPHNDVLLALAKHRRPLERMLVHDQKRKAPFGSKRGFMKEIDFLWRRGDVTSEQLINYKHSYIFNHGLGFYNAFHVTPQAGFPNITVDGKTIRADIFVSVPSNDNFRLVVECDGYEFHKSKDRFIADRKRDRALKAEGIDVLRFSGAEINLDPCKSSLELFEHLQNVREDCMTIGRERSVRPDAQSRRS